MYSDINLVNSLTYVLSTVKLNGMTSRWIAVNDEGVF